ncbi:CYTH domain-containing protein [Salinimicrobium catena]|uniref:CYTH domain-containing protein n=1 Tax=Salinimicrobium catena TaxID=390640 RepID=A0A1H5J112_9FLAO|nr:CYTH domain-containing protein [Salinimicrobium catena]SDK82203.1 CYTH domain-containing protein [Salinimicrobium catena]SEE45338.1 CYTH domain-containing protein [Salinimicrobium catena]
MTEIERKFLVPAIQPVIEEAFRQTRILQGYLNSDPDRTVRVRIKGSEAFLTVKGRSSKSGMSRFEWEKEISVPEAEDLLKICEPGAIEKVRYEVKAGDHIFEVDEFFGANEGLLLAEIELSSEEEKFEKPSWLGKEVTGNKMYYNSYLSKFPYKEWQNLHL